MRDKNAKRGGPVGSHSDRAAGSPKGLAARIVARRMALGLSQESAARALGVARGTLASWELGRAPRGLYGVALDRWLKGEE